jgi:hypothetical protein
MDRFPWRLFWEVVVFVIVLSGLIIFLCTL